MRKRALRNCVSPQPELADRIAQNGHVMMPMAFLPNFLVIN